MACERLLVAPLVAPDGTLRQGPAPSTAIMNRNGSLRRVLVAGGVQAIGVDGRLYGVSGLGLAAYTPAGRLLWRTSRLDAAPEASDPRCSWSRRITTSYWLAEQDTPVALDGAGHRIWDSEGDCCFRMPVLAVGPDGTVYYSPPSFAASGLVAGGRMERRCGSGPSRLAPPHRRRR